MSALTAIDLEMCRGLGITDALLNKAGVERVSDSEAREICKLVGPGDLAGIVFPYFVPGNGDHAVYCRVRRDHPEIGEDGRPLRKYLAPPASAGLHPHPYFPPAAQELCADATVPLVLVESEKATLSLIAWSARTGRKILPIGLGGCWGWSAVIDQKEVKGEKQDVRGLHPDLAGVCRDRKTYVLLDANAATSADVQKARRRLTEELRAIGAEVHVLDLPTATGVNGPDDFIREQGDQALTDLFDDQKTGSAVLSEVERFLRRFMVMTDAQFVAVVLWIAHTHAIDACVFTPYLAITSAEKRCAKSRLLEVLEYLVREPWPTSGATAAALFRRIDARKPSLLLDEVDAILQADKEMAQAIRGVLNAGNKAGATISRCVGKGTEMLVKDFATFCPKAVSGIGSLPDTVRDRSLPIRLQRKLTSTKVERLRARLVKPDAGPLRERLKNWVEGQIPRLTDARPQMPEELNDRQQDGAEILFALADCAGGDWPARTRKALLELFQSEDAGEDSHRMRLLVDLRDLFNRLPLAEALPTDQILEELKTLEGSPWGDWNHGKGLTRHALAKILRPFEVYPGRFREKGSQISGYQKSSLVPVWDRYLPPLSVTPPIQSTHLHNASIGAASEASEQSTQEPSRVDHSKEVSSSNDAPLGRCADWEPGVEGDAQESTAATATLPEPTQLPALDALAESEAIRRHFQEQEAIWRADPHAPPKMPDTSGLIPFMAATQLELADDCQIFYEEAPDLRPGRGCDVGMADDEHRKRKDYYCARRRIR